MFKLALVLMAFAAAAMALPDSGAWGSPALTIPAEVDTTGQAYLTTQFNQNNNYAGNSFDLEALTDLTVVGWDVNLGTEVSLWTVHVYWREGTANGFEQNASGWTELGVDSVVGQGINNPTHIDVGGLQMSTGDVIGIIITAEEAVSGTGGFYYTNGGPTTYNNSDLEITTYRGLAEGFPPGSVFSYREWNGTVHYNYGVPVQRSTWADIKTSF